MDGDIDVVSESGKGSNFRFSFNVSPVYDQSKRFTEAMQEISKSFIKTRVLVADMHHSTVDMMTNLLPTLPLDGVSDYAELQQETPYGVVIVGLLLDHKEGTLTRWENELQKIMKRAKVTVIMHYPLGTTNVQGNIGGVGPILEAASSSVENEQRQQQQPFHISSYGYLDEQQNIVRMGVPLRRNKLLRMLASFLNEDKSASPVPKSRPNIFARITSSEIKLAIETIPEEHRKAFKKTNILVAEGRPTASRVVKIFILTSTIFQIILLPKSYFANSSNDMDSMSRVPIMERKQLMHGPNDLLDTLKWHCLIIICPSVVVWKRPRPFGKMKRSRTARNDCPLWHSQQTSKTVREQFASMLAWMGKFYLINI